MPIIIADPWWLTAGRIVDFSRMAWVTTKRKPWKQSRKIAFIYNVEHHQGHRKHKLQLLIKKNTSSLPIGTWKDDKGSNFAYPFRNDQVELLSFIESQYLYAMAWLVLTRKIIYLAAKMHSYILIQYVLECLQCNAIFVTCLYPKKNAAQHPS